MVRRALLLVLLSAVLAAASAAAVPSKRPPLAKVLRGEALESYEAARQHFKSQRYQQALAGFVRAHVLSREPRLLWNSAACLRKLERNAEALRNLDAYLAEGAGELVPEELDEARRSQDAVRELVATLRITTVPADALISVDGTSVEAAFGQGIYVEPGRHAFLFGKGGHEQKVRQETLRAGETVDWTVELVPLAEVRPSNPAAGAAPASGSGLQAALVVAPRSRTPWLVVGGGAAAGAVGGVLLGVSAGEYQRLKQECGTMCSPRRVALSRSEETAGVVLVSAGAAAVAAGLGWWLFPDTEVRAQVAVAPAGVTVGGRF